MTVIMHCLFQQFGALDVAKIITTDFDALLMFTMNFFDLFGKGRR